MMTAQDEIERKRRELAALVAQQNHCPHEWGADIKYVPREEGGYEAEDYLFPIPGRKVWVERKIFPRWSRTCRTCGKTEYTERTRIITRAGSIPGTKSEEHVPDFAEERRPTFRWVP